MTAIAILNRDKIIEQVANGDRITDIAHSFGLSNHVAISKVLAKDPDYIEAREAGHEAKMERRETEMENASDTVTVARTRELLNHARWRAEREFPGKWGQKIEAKIDASLTVHVVRLAAPAIEGSYAHIAEQLPQCTTPITKSDK